MLSHWFLTAAVPIALCTSYHHNPWLVVLSYAVAAFAAYTAFHLLERVRAATSWSARLTWLTTTGLSMGFGIWAMHFIAILAVEIAIPIRFDLPTTAVSAGVAIVASLVAFAVVTTGLTDRARLAAAGLVLGCGIATMHYVGMAALRLPAHLYYEPWLFALSALVAVLFSTGALWALTTLPRLRGAWAPFARPLGAAVMGLAIVLMHYTGMVSTYFFPEPGLPQAGLLVDRPTMAAAIACATLLVGGLTLTAAMFDQRATRAEALLRDAVDSISEGFVIYDADDRLVMCNEAYRRLYHSSIAALVPGTRFEDVMRAGLASGVYVAGRGHEEAWLAERLRSHRSAQGAVEHQLAGGIWLLVTERRMRNGGTAGLRIDITRLKAAQDALIDSERRLDRAQQMAGIGSWEFDARTGRRVWSKEMYRIRGVLADESAPTIGGLEQFTHPDDRARFYNWLNDLQAGRRSQPIEYRITRPDGMERIVVADGQPVTDADGTVTRVAGTLRDVTDQRRTEAQLLQAQKMETVGQLTGGLAHDFNNILGGIVGNLDLAIEGAGDGSVAARHCQRALDAALSGVELVKRLLALSRRQALHPGRTNIEAAIAGLLPLVNVTLGQRVRVRTDMTPGLWPAFTDTAQLESAILNLVVNARDAMPNGGVVDIAAANMQLDHPLPMVSGELPPGGYIMLTIRDTGTGMPPEVLSRAFEPFFTTKPAETGSGLGLGMVLGTMQQLGGGVAIESQPGAGTTVRLYLPRAPHDRPDATDEPTAKRALPAGRERILMVEDNTQVRTVGSDMLRSLGYQVILATHADEALQWIDAGEAFDLLFSDVVMPGRLNGIALARELRSRNPAARILLTTGFSSPMTLEEDRVAIGADLIPKPYRRAELAVAVRASLDRVADAIA